MPVTEPEVLRAERILALHARLLTVAGQVPDGELTRARAALADHRWTEVSRFLSTVPGSERRPEYAFDAGAWEWDALDTAAVAAAKDLGLYGMWRTWRAVNGSSRRVFLAETPVDRAPHLTTARLQDRLSDAGEADPQAEVFAAGDVLPPYHTAAFADATLLWTAEPALDMPIAPTCDAALRAEGALGGEEQEMLLEYLLDGIPVLTTSLRIDDVIDNRRRAIVPTNWYTDGHWLWSDAVAYYVAEYGLRPYKPLLAHIQAAGYKPGPVSWVTRSRACQQLLWREPTSGRHPARTAPSRTG